MTNDDFIKLAHSLTTHSYTFAKTMPKHPHWYTLRWDWDDSEFVEAVKLLRANGYERRFYSKSYTSFDLNESYYWTMGEPIDKDGKPWTYVLNKARRDAGGQYDAIAGSYDGLFTDDASLAENERVFSEIGWEEGQSVLDIGCGTGLFLEYNGMVSDYVGVDPSAGMLSVLKGKFGKRFTTVCTDFERFYLPRRFDRIVATFGSASYMEPGVIGRVRHFLEDGGEAFLMFYKDGYRPRTYGKTGLEFRHHPYSEYVPFMGGHQASEYHDYMIARIRA